MKASSEQHNPTEGAPAQPGASPFFVKFLATGFYSGYSPVAPGTTGTLAGLAVYLLPSFEQLTVIAPAIILGFLFGIYAGTRLENTFGHDPAVVVIDEMVGLWISLFLLPKTPLVIIGAFVLFRILDTIKPQPAKLFQKKGGGLSIMMDDVVVAVYTNIVIRLVVFLFTIL